MKTARQKAAANARYRSKFKRAVRKGAANRNISEAGVSLIEDGEEE